jgi:putative tryptophan/tyrosine transport system substrate-binding protein
VGAGPTTSRKRELIAALTLRYRLLTVNLVRIYVENGLLASYGPDFTEMYRRAASYVDRILQGEKPRDLPYSCRPSLN